MKTVAIGCGQQMGGPSSGRPAVARQLDGILRGPAPCTLALCAEAISSRPVTGLSRLRCPQAGQTSCHCAEL